MVFSSDAESADDDAAAFFFFPLRPLAGGPLACVVRVLEPFRSLAL